MKEKREMTENEIIRLLQGTIRSEKSIDEQREAFSAHDKKQVKELLTKKGYKVDKTQIRIDHPITSLGTHNVEIELHKSVIATIKIQVTK